MCGTPQRSRRTSTALSSPVRRTRPSRTASLARAESRSASRLRRAYRAEGAVLVRRVSWARVEAARVTKRSGTRRAFTPTKLVDPVPDAAPADVGEGRQRPVARVPVAQLGIAVARSRAVGVVDDERTPAHVVLRHDAPVATVLRAIAIVAHHEKMRLGNEQRTPVVMRRRRRRIAEARASHLDAMLPGEQLVGGVGRGRIDAIRGA